MLELYFKREKKEKEKKKHPKRVPWCVLVFFPFVSPVTPVSSLSARLVILGDFLNAQKWMQRERESDRERGGEGGRERGGAMETRKRGEDGGHSLTAGGQQAPKRGLERPEPDRIRTLLMHIS